MRYPFCYTNLYKEKMSKSLEGRVITWKHKITGRPANKVIIDKCKNEDCQNTVKRYDCQSWRKTGKGYYCSKSCSLRGKNRGFKKGLIPWNKGKHFLQITGSKNKSWKGGITPINRRIRTSLEYILWRTAVFVRDNYTCIQCGDNQGGNLEADHIKPFALYPELRFAIDNGRTLCHECHRKTNTYAGKMIKIRRETYDQQSITTN